MRSVLKKIRGHGSGEFGVLYEHGRCDCGWPMRENYAEHRMVCCNDECPLRGSV